MADIFISYSKARVAEATELAAELADLGYEVWWDTSLLPTGSFGAEIDRQLDAARAVIVIWSPESIRSKWVRSEAAHADRLDKLVNTHTDGIAPATQIPKPFDQTHSVALDNIRTIVAALDALQVPRSGGSVLAAEPSVTLSAAAADDRLFAEVEAAGTLEAYQFYLDELPQGAHASLARFWLKGLETAAPKTTTAPRGAPPSTAAVRSQVLKPGDIFTDIKGVTPEMVVVPAGEFMMGDEGEQHKVTISQPFAVAKFPAIFDEWDKARELGFQGPRLDDSWGRGRQPVINVSWDEAKAYAGWLASHSGKPYRLLTEAEWEYACRAGSKTRFCFGDSDGDLGQYAWFSGNAGYKPHPVGEKRPNAFGLYDMHGNVWEWVSDWNGEYSSGPHTDPRGPVSDRFRVFRGGSWSHGAQYLRSANRSNDAPGYRLFNLGFRLARTL